MPNNAPVRYAPATAETMSAPEPARALPKTPTGIAGLDEITGGGLPRARPTLCVRQRRLRQDAACDGVPGPRAHAIRRAGRCITFEETEEELAQNVASLGFDVEALVADKRLAFDHVHVDKREIEETGEYDLEGLFLRLGLAIDSVGAKRVVLDTIESLFSGFSNRRSFVPSCGDCSAG
jgi:circadian clock protein KaiC